MNMGPGSDFAHAKNPSDYVFRVVKDDKGDETITPEKRGTGFCIWFKVNILRDDSYKLSKVAGVLEKIQNNLSTATISNIKNRIKINKYSENHPKDTQTISTLIKVFAGLKKPNTTQSTQNTQSTQTLKTTPTPHTSSQVDFVDNFIQTYLQPYLNGDIPPEKEDRNRPPIIETLYPQFQKEFPASTLSKADVEKMALDAYILEGAKGLAKVVLAQNEGKKVDSEQDTTILEKNIVPIISPNDKKTIALLCNALSHSLPIDFKNKPLTKETIAEKAKQAFSILANEHGRIHFEAQLRVALSNNNANELLPGWDASMLQALNTCVDSGKPELATALVDRIPRNLLPHERQTAIDCLIHLIQIDKESKFKYVKWQLLVQLLQQTTPLTDSEKKKIVQELLKTDQTEQGWDALLLTALHQCHNLQQARIIISRLSNNLQPTSQQLAITFLRKISDDNRLIIATDELLKKLDSQKTRLTDDNRKTVKAIREKIDKALEPFTKKKGSGT